MYTIIPIPTGRLLVKSTVIASIRMPLIELSKSIQSCDNEDDLHAIVVDVFDEDNEALVGVDNHQRQMIAVTILNVLRHLVIDEVRFVDNLNHDMTSYKTGLEVGFDGVFYPADRGYFEVRDEFVIAA